MKQSEKKFSPKKTFKSLKKINEFFDKRLDLLVNNAIDRVRLPCPYSRVSELIILDKCISLKKKNAVEKLDLLLQRQEKLAKQIKQETMDLKGIVGRQSRELVEGKVKNVKILYESEIYLLNISVDRARAQVENYIKSNEEVEEENKKCRLLYDCQDIDTTEQKKLEREITQLLTECDIVEAEIDEIEMQLADANGNGNNGFNLNKDSYYSNGNDTDDGSSNNDGNNINSLNSMKNMLKNKNGGQSPEEIEANANIASLKNLPWLIHNIFNKLVNE